MTYADLLKPGISQYYKEDTNVFAYYVLVSLFMYNFDKVMKWMMVNNEGVLNFSKDERSVVVFIYFINEIYCKKDFIQELNRYNKHDDENLKMSIIDCVL